PAAPSRTESPMAAAEIGGGGGGVVGGGAGSACDTGSDVSWVAGGASAPPVRAATVEVCSDWPAGEGGAVRRAALSAATTCCPARRDAAIGSVDGRLAMKKPTSTNAAAAHVH